MLISEGYFYHISDSFFQLAADGTLMSNYENGHYRPHFLAVKDSKNSAIFWMIPVSSRYAKFQGIYDNQIKKYGRCTKIVLGISHQKRPVLCEPHSFAKGLVSLITLPRHIFVYPTSQFSRLTPLPCISSS